MTPLLLARALQTTGAVVLAGTLLLRLLATGASTDGVRPRLSGLAWGSWATLVAGSLAVLGWTAASMSGETIAEVLGDGSVRTVLATTRFGAVWLVRAGLLASLFIVGSVAQIFARCEPLRTVRVSLDGAQMFLAAAVLATLVWAGHAHSGARAGWLLPMAVVHALAAGAWPGGLLPVAVLLVCAARDPTLARSTALIVARFSRLSVVAVAVLGLSGLCNAGLVGGLAALSPWMVWTHIYGRLLCCKAALFVAMVSLGAWNRRLLAQNAAEDAPALFSPRLCWNVVLECVLAAGVLLATEALAMTAPPR